MAFSARKPHLHHLHLQPPYAATSAPPPTPSATTSAPPPTPSAHPHHLFDTSAAADALSHILQRLPPILSIPNRRPSSTTPTTPPLISLSYPTPSLLSAATQLGFFHLTHNRHPRLPSNAAALFDLPDNQKPTLFPTIWPLGYDTSWDDDVSAGESFCLDPLLDLELFDGACLREFGLEMEKIGLKVVEQLASVFGFKNPTREELCSLLWISDDETNKAGRVYPYVVGLHCRVESGKWSLLSDSGWVDVSDQEDSVLVTLGDIAQVWSNGKIKKVRGRPVPSSGEDNNKSRCITMSLLITLPVESTISPRLLDLPNCIEEQEDEDGDDSTKITGELRQFRSFSFEDYAWRVYHERLLLKDPLIRYRL